VCARAKFHSRWSDTESSEEGIGTEAAYGAVKPELQNVNINVS